ncbi:S8 family peptidase [Rubrolithibacter danxiaensis]|uniref:S8 family peptidase n=1 Tax=Rubrolithibacter danxiaensis TaxID=3390805 RepID=UPI003BF82C07
MNIKIREFIGFLLLAALPLFSVAQDEKRPPANWQNLDLPSNGVFGISTEKAYSLLKGKKSVPVVVAVIDGGVDEEHEDIKNVIWINSKEVAGNKKDDDKNGYADDINGWNFIGSDIGNVHYDNLEVTRLVRKLRPKYASVVNSTPLDSAERKEFNFYKRLVEDYINSYQNAKNGSEFYTNLKKYTDQIVEKIGKKEPSLADFENYKTEDANESKALKVIKSELKKDKTFKEFYDDLKEGVEYFNTQVNYGYNLDFNPRDTVGDNYANSLERFYGNNDITGPDADHGTHVAGIIAASRSNNIGVKGVADNVKIMGVRAVPNGDERDKDVANAIRYAADNGAKVINMSFGKSYSWDKAIVDSAVRYAMSKDVLLVHAAGNESKNIDKEPNYPNRYYQDSTGLTMGTAAAWIEVGASDFTNDENLVASFSNYGAKSVDVFAPGVKINSTVPGSKYKENDGTSMASPVVAGLAALIRSYYPSLSAVEVKNIILQSVTKVDHKVKIKEEGDSKKVNFDEVCISGGIVNAYNAIQLAEKQAKKK